MLLQVTKALTAMVAEAMSRALLSDVGEAGMASS